VIEIDSGEGTGGKCLFSTSGAWEQYITMLVLIGSVRDAVLIGRF